MRLSLPIVVMMLFSTTSLSKSTCEDDENFHDSYGWTCKDYDRAPYQCNQSTKYEKNGETALTSCCACVGSSKGSIFTRDSGTRIDNKFAMIRRATFECLSGCTAETESCKDFCGNDKSRCETRCTDVQATCDYQCELIDEVEDEVNDNGVVVTDDDDTAGSSNSTQMQLIYILIGAIALLGLCCCCVIFIFLMRNRVKTAVAGPAPRAEEQTHMVGQPNAQGDGDWYAPDPYHSYNQISAPPCQGGPVY